ncbi:rhomboid family intramembrane serine protease [Streptomyces diastaticus]|nr:rhomboid family intramembrane serine protease [Streptomyces diastaticus]
MDSGSTVTRCYRHPAVECHVRCTGCARYICPDCERAAPVGRRCPECVREGARPARRARTLGGGRISTTPVVTYALVALTVLAYLAEVVRPGLVDRFALVGSRLVDPEGTRYVGDGLVLGSAPLRTEGVAGGEWERLLTSAFLHQSPFEGAFGILHVTVNMVVLWQSGRVVELMLGRVRFLALYLLSALGGSVLELVLADPGHASAGASGAVCGVGAASYVLHRRLGATAGRADRLAAGLLLWLVVSAWFAPWQVPVGGLLAGGALALAFAYAPRDRRPVAVQTGAAAALAVLPAVTAAWKVSELTGGSIPL